ncbi:PREDICTED: uncharacterized protein LOC108693717 [Atta colombica]|uniref:uncharacterized protein LOC108693717 n=1 Tax=Atta colombica TaxID=520822 RepID=UPI00084C84DB|nr:PREDICTED: uncharacterized protein LOC108693717 [Atta colombica]
MRYDAIASESTEVVGLTHTRCFFRVMEQPTLLYTSGRLFTRMSFYTRETLVTGALSDIYRLLSLATRLSLCLSCLPACMRACVQTYVGTCMHSSPRRCATPRDSSSRLENDVNLQQ